MSDIGGSSSAGDPDVSGGQDATEAAAPRRRGAQMIPILVFDVGGPLAVYYGLRSANVSTVSALILSGIPPAIGIAVSALRKRRLDALGALVLAGIIVGSVAGLVSKNAKVVLLDGLVPAVVFGTACLVSLRSSRPLMFRFALEGIGPDTRKGREFADRWQYEGFRRAFRVITTMWGVVFFVSAGVQAIIIEEASASVAKTSSNFLPLTFTALAGAWTYAYGKRKEAQGRARAAAEAAEAAEAAGPSEAAESACAATAVQASDASDVNTAVAEPS
ncbi:MAG TPA: VC0807 family protein [Acidimicrobiales bacterium]|nr:VC0807 family protein [Acidimicrobiales bacterium]